MKQKRTRLIYCLTIASIIGCGKDEKDTRSSPNVIDKNLLATLELKNCEKGPCADDPCMIRQKSGWDESARASQIKTLVQKFNDQVCKERPWRGYLLTEEIVKRSVEAQLDSVPEPRRSDFTALIKNDLKNQTDLEFIGDTSCPLKGSTKYFFPRLSIMDEWKEIPGGQGTSQGGYSLPVGNDIEESCP